MTILQNRRILAIMVAIAASAIQTLNAPPAPATSTPRAIPQTALELVHVAELPLPAEWQGEWEYVATRYDCSSGEILADTSVTDTLCAGEPVGQRFGPTVECMGFADATTLELTCEGTYWNGCTVTHRELATRTGDTALIVMVTRYNGGPECESRCDSTVIQATRIGPATGVCSPPVEESSWGYLKRLYE